MCGSVRGTRLCRCLSLSVGLIVLVSFPYCTETPELSPLTSGKGLRWLVGSVCGHMAQCSRPLVRGGCGQGGLLTSWCLGSKMNETKGWNAKIPFQDTHLVNFSSWEPPEGSTFAPVVLQTRDKSFNR